MSSNASKTNSPATAGSAQQRVSDIKAGLQGWLKRGNSANKKTTISKQENDARKRQMRNLADENEQLKLQVQQIKSIMREQIADAKKKALEAVNNGSVSDETLKTKAELETLRADIKKLQGELCVTKVAATKEKNALLKQIEDFNETELKTKLKTLEIHNEDLLDEIDVLQISRSQSDATLQKTMSEVEELKLQVSTSTETIDKLKTQLQATKSQSSKSSIKKLQDNVAVNTKMEKELSHLRTQLLNESDQRSQLDDALMEAMGENSKLRIDLKALEATEKETQKKTSLAKIALIKAENSIQLKNDEICSIQETLNKERQMFTQLKESLEISETDKNHLSEKNKILTEEIQNLKNKCEMIEKRRINASLKAEELEVQLNESTEQMAKLKIDIQDVKDDAVVKGKREVALIKTLKKELQKLHTKYGQLESTYKHVVQSTSTANVHRETMAVPVSKNSSSPITFESSNSTEKTPSFQSPDNQLKNSNLTQSITSAKSAKTSSSIKARAIAAAAKARTLFSDFDSPLSNNNGGVHSQNDKDGVKKALAKRLQQLLQQNAKVREEIRFLQENVQILNKELREKNSHIQALERKLKSRGPLARMTPKKGTTRGSVSSEKNISSSSRKSKSSYVVDTLTSPSVLFGKDSTKNTTTKTLVATATDSDNTTFSAKNTDVMPQTDNKNEIETDKSNKDMTEKDKDSITETARDIQIATPESIENLNNFLATSSEESEEDEACYKIVDL